MAHRSLTLQTPAKVNLTLRITGKRDDGFHLLETVLAAVELWDRLVVRASSHGDYRFRCPAAPHLEDRSNLVHRAAAAFFAALDRRPEAHLLLEKSIPVAAGLGGGSSDAAATLLALNQLYDHPLAPRRLMHLGAELGSDIPFFIRGRIVASGMGMESGGEEARLRVPPALARGRGDELTEVRDLPQAHLLLVDPGIQVSTAWAYRQFDRMRLTKEVGSGKDACFAGGLKSLAESLHNHLEEVVIPAHPVVAEMKRRLLEAGAWGAQMSGSGPVVFGLFPGLAEAVTARERLSTEPQWRLHCVALMP